jgi:hypothetical protein
VAMVTEVLKHLAPDGAPADVDIAVSEDANGAAYVMAMKNARLINEPGVVNNVGVPNGIRNVTDRLGGRRRRARTSRDSPGRLSQETPRILERCPRPALAPTAC